MTLINRALDINIRGVDEERREISGWATVPATDRVGDIVDPMGAKFADSIPLLVGHDHGLPVGRVTLGRPTKAGIPFTARLPKIAEPGPLQDRVNSAWLAAKYKLIDSVSIGFRTIANGIERIDGGFRHTAYEILELSLVAVPAAPGAKITATKAAGHVVTLHPGHVAKLKTPTPHHVVRLTDRDRRVGAYAAKLQASTRARHEREARLEQIRRELEERQWRMRQPWTSEQG